jgi:hypothetical protein
LGTWSSVTVLNQPACAANLLQNFLDGFQFGCGLLLKQLPNLFSRAASFNVTNAKTYLLAVLAIKQRTGCGTNQQMKHEHKEHNQFSF